MTKTLQPNSEQSKLIFDIKVATVADIPSIEKVRYKVWRSNYPQLAPDYLSVDDVDKIFADQSAGIAEGKQGVSDPDFDIRVARYENDIVGFSMARKSSESEGEVLSLYVLDEYQGNGIGKALTKSTLNWLEPQTRVIKLAVVEGNDRAIGLYSQLGFKITRKFPVEAPTPPKKYIPHVEMVREAGLLQ